MASEIRRLFFFCLKILRAGLKLSEDRFEDTEGWLIRHIYSSYYEKLSEGGNYMNWLKKNSDGVLFVIGISLVTVGLYWIYKALKRK